MKALLITSALIEAAVGASMLILPAFTASLLLGTSLDTPGGLVVARVAGGALGALAIACWNSRNSRGEGSAMGVIAAMLFYNFAAAAVLVWAATRLELSSTLLWPTIALHLALGAWCAFSLWSTQRKSSEG